MSKTVFFDLGNVILFFSHDKMCQQIALFCDLALEKVKSTIFLEGWGQRYERGLIDSREIYQHFCQISSKKISFTGLMRAVSDIFEPNVAMNALIKELKKNDVRLLILSNTCQAHFDFAFTHFPILHLFDGYVLSYEVGSIKPEPKIFEKALDLAHCPKEACFFTDDMLEHVQSAQKLGIDAEVYSSTDSLVEQLKKRKFLS
jgi:putative hydrolase of the HAD superfamily